MRIMNICNTSYFGFLEMTICPQTYFLTEFLVENFYFLAKHKKKCRNLILKLIENRYKNIIFQKFSKNSYSLAQNMSYWLFKPLNTYFTKLKKSLKKENF
jgi:hypothetical protein